MSEFTGEVHPVADLFPMLPDDELSELADDIAERGLLQAVVLDTEGRVLDGRNRLAACKQAGVEPTFTTFDGDDPDGYALAVNISRRHLSKGQQAMVAARAALICDKSQRALATENGVSQPRLAYAKTVLDHAPDLADAVVAGATPLDTAYQTARERKQAAQSADARLDELRAQAPDLADAVVEERMALSEAIAAYRQREEDRQGTIRRTRKGLEELVNGWIRLEGLADYPWRDEALEGLTEQDRQKVLEIETIYEKGTS